MTCTATDHAEWVSWRADDGTVLALLYSYCGATATPPEVEPGRRLVELPGEPDDGRP